MGEVLPLKGIFSGSTVTGLGEFRTATADVIGVAHGGTGLATIAANRICLLYTSPSPRDS